MRALVFMLVFALAAPAVAVVPNVNGVPPALQPLLERQAKSAVARIAPDAGLRVEAIFNAPAGGHIVRLQQTYRGLPVLRAVATVRLDAAGNVLRIANGLARLPAGLDVTPAISKSDALHAARLAAVGVLLPKDERGEALLVVLPTGRLAFVVDVATLTPAALEAEVDAKTGEVLALHDRAMHALAAGVGNVFADSPAALAAHHLDGSMDASATTEAPLDGLVSTNAGDTLTGTDIVANDCCPTEGCDPAAAPKKVDGTVNVTAPVVGPIAITVHSVMCDQLQVAKADQNGDFLFDPAKEPVGDHPAIPIAADSDPFSEVMAYHFAESELEFVRTLDPTFQLSADARPLHVTANFTLPNIQEAYDEFQQNPQAVLQSRSVTITSLMRLDNSAYVPRGAAAQLGAVVPGLDQPYDTLFLFQGTSADFGYDPDVISHEFGHGIVEATAQLADDSQDDQGVLDAPAALNEGTADLWAALREDDPHVGEYVGHLLGQGEGGLRDLTNTFSCPSVIQGEPHQDSQHFSAAVWEARSQIATTAGDKLEFGQAFLAALRTMTPFSTFDDAATAIADEVGTTFDADAKAKAEAVFAERKLTGCERVEDVDPAHASGPLLLAGADESRGWSPYAPGPMQFRLQVPAGATSVAVDLAAGAAGLSGGSLPGLGGAAQLQALVRADDRLHFTYGQSVSSDATSTVTFTGAAGSDETATVPVDGGCDGKTYFLALGNESQAPFQLQSLAVTYTVDQTKVAACHAPDAGTPDAGSSGGSGGDTAKAGCGCTSPGELAVVMLAGLVALVRRRRFG